jgi:hypothetical protein
MKKLRALFERYRPFIALLAKSKTIQGIVATAIGTAIAYAQSHLPAAVLDVAGELIAATGVSLQVGGLGWAFRGRMKAAGPIELPGPGAGVQGPGFDGTGGELSQ